MIWLKFTAIQLVMLAATVAGWFVLLPFCWARAWHAETFVSLVEGVPLRFPDEWNWSPLNWIYGNPEDGVSGQQALIWTSDGRQVPYMPNAPAWWRAYCWSALRNSCDNLKYVFADPKGPLVTFKLFGREGKIGWQMENGYNVPVISL